MAKKNEFVITVGFNRNDADHTKAVDILNKMGRTKAQYIAKAVLAYNGKKDKATGSAGINDTINYSEIRRYVEGIMEQRIGELENADMRKKDKAETGKGNHAPAIGENAKNNIMESLKAFRSGGT